MRLYSPELPSKIHEIYSKYAQENVKPKTTASHFFDLKHNVSPNMTEEELETLSKEFMKPLIC